MIDEMRNNIDDLLKIGKITFTEREVDVISCLTRGKSAKTMAVLLAISPHTIKTHIQNIMRKLDCNSQEQIIKFIESSGKHMLFYQHYASKFNSVHLENSGPNTFTTPNHCAPKSKKYLISIIIALLILILSGTMFLLGNKSIAITNSQILSKDILLPRKDPMQKIDKAFNKQSGVRFAILTGCGGAGKTTIARLYLRSQNSKIKWEINAETTESILNSFADLANVLASTNELRDDLLYIKSIANSLERGKKLVSFVITELKKSNDWCLLFDNVDDFNAVKPYILFDSKICGNGKILITTRNENLKNIGYFHNFSSIDVGDLSKDEQLKLFCGILHGSDTKLSNEKLIEVKGFLQNIPTLPLDVSAAAYYLKNMQIPFKEYLEITQKISKDFDKTQIRLLTENLNYNSTRYGIITSTFDDILKSHSEFKELLLFICLTDSHSIQKRLLKKFKNHVVVNDFIYNLRKHSLITGDGHTFSIHRSTQEIGLTYIMNLLTESEKIKYLDEIVKAMTPYNEMGWRFYTSYLYKMDKNEKVLLFRHSSSIINKIRHMNLPRKKQDEYHTKLLFAFALTSNAVQSQSEREDALKEVLKLNENNGYIQDYDVAVALTILSSDYLRSGKYSEAEKYIRKNLELLKNLDNANNLYILNLAYMGGVHAKTNNFEKAKECIEKSWNLVLKTKENWTNIIMPMVWYQLHYNYIDHYINKKEGIASINYGLDLLDILGASEFFYKKNSSQIDEIPYFTAGIRERLANAYNRFEEYDKALECEDEAYYLFRKNSGIEDIKTVRGRSRVDAEYGCTLLRTEKIKEAEGVLEKVIGIRLKFHDKYILLYTITNLAETKIRLEKLDEAYEYCQHELSEKNNPKNNYSQLLVCTIYYHAAVIKHKQKDYILSTKHFKDFFKKAEGFCKGFLDRGKLKHLNEIRAFENNKDIQKCLTNSLEIFKAIYGENHSFVKNYASKN